MTRKLLSLALATAVIGLFGTAASADGEQQPAVLKNLVVYYSFTGNTELAAKTLAECVKADVIKLEDVKKPSRDEAYKAGKDASLQGKAWPIKPFNKDFSGYNRVFVGCPVWFGMPTPEFNAFVEQADFSGRQVVVFVTLGGGSPDKALKTMTEKIEAKGGKIVSSFYVRTKNASTNDIVNKTKEIAGQYSPGAAH